MWVVIAVVTLAATFAVVLAAVHRVRRRPFAVDVILSLAVMICLETAIVNVLSPFHAVARGWVVLAHLVVIGFAWGVLRQRAVARGVRLSGLAIRRLGWGGAVLVPLAALIALSAWRYAPNSWDSMSYHLARVAHWIQHRSVANYETNIVRQVSLQPGAEYLILVLQVVSGTDRLASSVQLVAWLAVVLAAPALARLAGAPKRVAIAAAPIVAAAPMIVLQASSTQNDLVAAVAAMAGIAASMPFLHRGAGRWRIADAGLLGLALAACAVVKLTASLAALPVVMAAVFQSARRLSSGAEPARRAAMGAGLLLMLASAIAVPEVVRRWGDARLSGYVARFTYPILGDFADRALNVVRATFRHVPAPHAVVAALGIPDRCVQNGWLSSDALASDHEEYAGNALLVLFALAAAGLAALRWRRLSGRRRLLLATTVAAWVLFQLTFRDNEWISRLEVPAFAVSAIFLAAVAGLPRRTARVARAGAMAVAIVAAASGTRTAAGNALRPPLRGFPYEVNGAESYYADLPQLRWVHETVLSSARGLGCERLGLALDEDSWDYPLTWPAMQDGIEVRHVLGRDPWPCLIFAEDPPAAPDALRWVPTNVPFLFLNAARE
jgi:hypothetical protein